MIDKFDYAEPRCPLCEGKDFYYPKENAPLGYIPVGRIIEKADSLFEKNKGEEAGRLLVYWRNEARSLRDKGGELSMESELVGYYRKQNDRENCLTSVSRALILSSELGQEDMASGATVFINCATAYKAFSMSDKAIPLYTRAEKIYKKCLNPNDARFGGLYNNMALALVDLERFEEAEYAYFTALAIMDGIKGGESESAVTYVNLAHMYASCGQQELISECMSNAYRLLKSESLVHDGHYAFVIEKCAPSFEYFGSREICDALREEAKKIYART